MESRRARRRVPQELRKRAQLSCDSCRKRRCKCVRPRENEVCLACQHSGLECRSTFAPKTRLYGSVETVGDRLRCLEAIVNALFPDEPTSTVSDLLALGRKRGYPMPDTSTLASMRNSTSEHENVHESLGLDNSTDNLAQSFPESRGKQDEAPYTTDKSQLIQDTSGRSHYIGPSGSLSFFADLRQLVSTRQPASRFASDNLAEALEARAQPDGANNPTPDNVISSPASFSSAIESLRSASFLRSLPFQLLLDLLELFFNKIHPDFPLFHRGLFLDRFEQYFLSDTANSTSDNTSDDGWLICLHMMIAFGCILRRSTAAADIEQNIDTSFHNIQMQCWYFVRASLGRLTTMCVQSHVQGLLLTSLYLHSIGERNAAWVLVGCAARIGIAIGLHRTELHRSFSLIERETRKCIWCTLYAFEQFLCLSLGRPSAIDDEEVKAEFPSDDIMGSGSGPPGCREFGFYLHQLCPKLRKTMSIHYRTSDVPGMGSHVSTDAVLHELSQWEKGLPSHLHLPNSLFEETVPSQSSIRQLHQFPTHHLRSVILLHIQYNELVLSATRPYLLMTISSSFQNPSSSSIYPWDSTETAAAQRNPRDRVWNFARHCVSAAFRVATLTLVLDNLNLLDGLVWLDVYFSYSAAMVLLLRVLWVPPGSGANNDNRILLTKEKSCKHSAVQVVEAVRESLRRINKSPTMYRFFSVVERFADVVTNSVLPSMQQQVGEPSTHEPRIDESYMNSPTAGGRHYIQPNTEQNTSQFHDQMMHSQDVLPPSNVEQARIPFNEGNIGVDRYGEENPFTGRVADLSSLPQDSMYGDTVLWDDPFHHITQHIVDWNDFEQFLGRWSNT